MEQSEVGQAMYVLALPTGLPLWRSGGARTWHTRGPGFEAACRRSITHAGDNADNVLAVSHARNRVWGTEYTNSSLSEQQTNYY